MVRIHCIPRRTYQNGHRHPYGPMNPETRGPNKGPSNIAHDQRPSNRPRIILSGYISARTPPTILKGGAPKVPAKNRKTKSATQFEESALPRFHATNPIDPISRMGFRPYPSLKGAKTSGPKTKPSRKRDDARTF